MSTFTDDLAHVRDQLRAARHLLHSGAPVPAVRAAAARLDDAARALLEAVIDQLDELQITALSGPARRVARDLVAQPDGATPAQVMTATGRSQAWVMRVLKTWVDAGVVTRLSEGRYAAVRNLP